MASMTKEETAWVKKVQKLLNECPSDRFAAYSIGDSDICLYDNAFEKDIQRAVNSSNIDWCGGVYNTDCELGRLFFPFSIHSTAG